jgi:hypothetical protein
MIKETHQGHLEHRTDESYIIVKAAPRRSNKYGETVCIAGLNANGTWVRLYPVSFVYLNEPQKFSRWDKVSYRWSLPKDIRTESRRVDPNSIQIVGKLPRSEITTFLNRSIVTSLVREREFNRSLALIRPEILEFWHEAKSQADIAEQEKVQNQLRNQLDMFAHKDAIPTRACPYEFKYRYRDNDGIHIGTCQDWETETTFFRRRSETDETQALEWMVQKFGVEFPAKGMALAMGTHRRFQDQWLINGVIRLDEEKQINLI